MEYNETIAKLTGQDKNAHEVLYQMNQSTSAIFQIIGECGSGKRTLADRIAELWQEQTQGIVIKLMPPLQSIPDDYSVFKNFIVQENMHAKRYINIFQESLKDIPYIGNSVSAMVKEIISFQHDKEKMQGTLSENEQYVISRIKKHCQKRKLLLVCSELDEWDLKSKNLICNIMGYKLLGGEATYFIATTKASNDFELVNATKKYLHSIACDRISEAVHFFAPQLQLDKKTIVEFDALTNGNLELIKELANMYSAPQSFLYTNYLQIIKENLANCSSNADELIQLLNEMAFIGFTTDLRLIKLFSQIPTKSFDDILAEAIKLSYLTKDANLISFVKRYVFTILEKNKYKDVHYYINLCKCINQLYPTRYDLRMRYAWHGNLTYEAENLCFLFLIKYYRENNIFYPLSVNVQEQLQKNNNYLFYRGLCDAYKAYKQKHYSSAEQILSKLYSSSKEFRFEKEYLISLITTNKYCSVDEFNERIDVLNSYITEDFKKDYPEMYLRALMMLAEFYSEVQNLDLAKKSIKKIGEIFFNYSLTDKQIQRYEHCFKLKANAFYKIEIASKYTQTAYDYFKEPENMQFNISDYYLSLLNHAANLIVLSKNADAQKLLEEACEIVRSNAFLEQIHKDILLNNLLINEYYLGYCPVEECISVYEELIQYNLDSADNLLVKNNYLVFVALKGDLRNALQLSESLYNHVRYNDDVDEYYRFYVLNNYCILSWLNDKPESAKSIWDEAKSLVPWPQDKAYFKARVAHISELLDTVSPNQLLKEANWNTYLYHKNSNVVGNAWRFWSNILLLSELQIWSDY